MSRSPRLWFATLGGMAAYALHLVGNYWLVPAACLWGTRMPLYVFTMVLLVIAAAATAVAVRLSRRGGSSGHGGASTAMDERVRFMSNLGVLLGALAVTLILFGGVGNFFFDPCQGTA